MEFDERALDGLVDLDDPVELVARAWRPSQIATRQRATTQTVALSLFAGGHAGFSWRSALEATWVNVTLFAERVAERLEIPGDPEPLSVSHPALRVAAEMLGIRLERQRT